MRVPFDSVSTASAKTRNFWDGAENNCLPGETDTVWMELEFSDDGGALSVKKIEAADYDSRLAEVEISLAQTRRGTGA